MKGFVRFIREQGVVGLAVGFILGGSIKEVVTSFVEDIVNPILGLVLGAAGNLTEATLTFGTITLKWGNFVSTMIDFLVIAGIVYFGVKKLGLDKLDKK